MASKQIREISNLTEILDLYDGFLFDAYGVLVDGDGPIQGAFDAWHGLRRQGKSCWILTNGSARTPSEAVAAYSSLGLQLETHELISSVSLLKRYFAEERLQGLKTAVLGTASTQNMVVEAGGAVCDLLHPASDFEVLVLGNQSDYPLLESLDKALSHIISRTERRLTTHLILSNPDLIYPKTRGQFGFTAGALALMIEAALKLRLGNHAPSFVRLGKPYGAMFAEAERRAGHRRLLMIGDQIETDIMGAQNYGLDSLLVGTGLTVLDDLTSLEAKPTYILRQWKGGSC